jgi:SAM-dependent methyltransferase
MLQRIDNLKRKALWQVSVPFRHESHDSVHVDLGAGNLPRNPFLASRIIATDFHGGFRNNGGVEYVQADLTRALPFADGSIDSFSAFDLLEHIPRWEREDGEIKFPFINLMSEISRCLKPGGIFLAVTPAFPSEGAFQDPTHINFISPATIKYFVSPDAWARNLEYGFTGKFEYITQFWLRGSGPFESWSEDLSTRPFTRLKIIKRLLVIGLRWHRQKPIHLVWLVRNLG